MPPKARLHSKHGKTANFPKKISNISPQPSSSVESTLDLVSVENERQFDVELCWCIQQLETSLDNRNINSKQAEESMKVLNVLKSSSQPVVRKRQLMRSHFGDYRTKMAAEHKKAKRVNSNISFSNSPSTSTKSTFLRKSAILTTGDNSFRFNFMPAMEEMSIDDTSGTQGGHLNGEKCSGTAQNTSTCNRALNFTNGTFKFNFNLD